MRYYAIVTCINYASRLYQNARAKEKKAKLAFAKSFGHEMPEAPAPVPEECKVCGVKYNVKFSSTSLQDHLFSKSHIENMKQYIEGQKHDGHTSDSSDFNNSSTMPMPMPLSTSANEQDSPHSKSGSNLLQQLQLMGLANALQGMPGGLPNLTGNDTSTMNGDSPKKQDKNAQQMRVTNPTMPLKKNANDADAANDDEDQNPFSSYGAFFGQTPGLQNFYPAAIQQYSTASGRPKI